MDASLDRRQWIAGTGAFLLAGSALGKPLADSVELPFADGKRAVTTAFPQKGAMILQRTRPPLLETPFAVFDKGVLTPVDQFYVRWHWSVIPPEIDATAFRLN